VKIYDLSLPIDDSAPEPFQVIIRRIGHAEGAGKVGKKFIYKKNDPILVKLRKAAQYITGRRRIDRGSFPDGMFMSHESVEASVHCGTHVDSPFHYGPQCAGMPSKKIEDLPLEWFYGDGVVLDVTGVKPGGTLGIGDIEAALERISYNLKPGDIVLFRTGADGNFGGPEYFFKFPGIGAEAVAFLIDKGIKVIGTDAPSLDRPFGLMAEDYYRTGDKNFLWPAHLMGRKKEYCQIERLANLDALPRPFGFRLACFPVKIKDVGAAFARAAAIFEDQEA